MRVSNPLLIMGLYCHRLSLARKVIFALLLDYAGCFAVVLGERAVPHKLSCHLELVRDQASHVDLAVTLFRHRLLRDQVDFLTCDSAFP